VLPKLRVETNRDLYADHDRRERLKLSNSCSQVEVAAQYAGSVRFAHGEEPTPADCWADFRPR
jgi:hypothetical protein